VRIPPLTTGPPLSDPAPPHDPVADADADPASDAPAPLRAGYDAVLLAGFGGPEGPDDVMPFLRNVTRGRGIPEDRLIEVSHHYLALGGVSPINTQNRDLRDALSVELAGRGQAVPVLWGNRNWAPYLADVIRDAHRDGLIRLLGLATSAYSEWRCRPPISSARSGSTRSRPIIIEPGSSRRSSTARRRHCELRSVLV